MGLLTPIKKGGLLSQTQQTPPLQVPEPEKRGLLSRLGGELKTAGGNLKKARRFLFPTRPELLQDIQQEKQQTLLPKFAREDIRKREQKEFQARVPIKQSKDETADQFQKRFLSQKEIDVFGIGATKRVPALLRKSLASLAKEKSKDVILKTLKKETPELSLTLRKKIAPRIARATSEQAVEREVAKVAQQSLGIKPKKITVSDDITTEAKKFNTAEEFVERDIDTFGDPGIWKDKTKAKIALRSKEGAEKTESEFLDQLIDAKKNIRDSGGRMKADTGQLLREKDAKDALKIIKEVRDELPTKSQLTDIFNKAKQPLKFSAEGIPLSTRSIAAQADQSGVSRRGTIQAPRDTTTSPVSEVQSLEQSLSAQGLPDKVELPSSLKQGSKEAISYRDSLQKKILNAREAEKELEVFNSVLPDPTEFITQVAEVRKWVSANDIRRKATKYKDISTIKKQFMNIFRSTERVFGADFATVKKNLLDPFDDSKGKYIDDLNTTLDSLSKNVVDKFNIQRGSVKSQWIQLYGEGKKTLSQVVEKFGKETADDIVESDKWFRKTYNTLIDRVNKIEQQIYPNNPEKWTPTRKDYYRHFKDLTSDFSQMQTILDNPVRIDPMLEGISQGTAPKSKWASFKQERLGLKTDEDAVGGFLDYLPSVNYAVNIDPHIGKFRELADILGRSTGKTKNINNYIFQLRGFADNLAGKTLGLDRAFIDHFPGGRDSLRAVSFANSRVKANTILANISSALAQPFNIPTSIATAGKINSLKAIEDSLGQIFVQSPEMVKSTFLKERYFRGFNKFNKGTYQNTKKLAVWTINVLDEVSTRFIWNSQLRRAKELGIKDPIRYADAETRLIVGGRGIGEKSLIQSQRIPQVFIPFQLEVTELMWNIGRINRQNPKVLPKIDKFATLFVALFIFNKITEQIRGTPVALDPIQATIDAVLEVQKRPTAKGVVRAGGRLAGEFLSNIPVGQTIAASLPEFGKTVLGVDIPSRKELFGKSDPTRFGGGLLLGKAVFDPATKLALPFGGSQVKKTIGGVQAILSGDSKTKSGVTRFKVGGSFFQNMQAVAFGQFSGKRAREFFEGTTYAEAVLKEIRSNPETAKEEMLNIAREDIDLAKRILKVIKKEELGITDDEQKLLNLGVSNQRRSNAVVKQLNKLKTNEEKKALLLNYVKKKILTPDVLKQVVEQLDK